MKCPSLNSILDYTRGELPLEERASIEAHFEEGCLSCQGNHSWLKEVLRLTAADNSYTLPEELILQVIAQFTSQSAPSPSSPRQFLAKLIFDGFFPRQMAEIRSLPSGGVVGRQFHYQTEGYDIDLRFERPEGARAEEMIGQVLARGTEMAEGQQQLRSLERGRFPVRLLQGGAEIGCVQVDARGVFRFAQVQSGIYSLKIRVPEGEINIEAVATACAAS